MKLISMKIVFHLSPSASSTAVKHSFGGKLFGNNCENELKPEIDVKLNLN